jgi:acetoacetyl-CoA synthetase
MTIEAAQLMWTPDPVWANATRMGQFIQWLKSEHNLEFADYDALWAWSVDDLEAFWTLAAAFLDVPFFVPATRMLSGRQQPGATWGDGAMVNMAALVQRHMDSDETALIVQSETEGRISLTWRELGQQVANLADYLRRQGVGVGDRVVAVLPNTQVSIVAFLATASLGAIWSLCAPDMGYAAVLDRFRQIEPKVIIAQDGSVYGGRMMDRSDALCDVIDGLDTLEQVIWVPMTTGGTAPTGAAIWADVIMGDASLTLTPVPFDHPLWVVYSSGTTGNPKPIVHGHGGVMLESSKWHGLHQSFGPDDRYCWMTSSGWIMWNTQVGVLGQGATVVMFDGAPNYPDLMTIWKLAEREKLTYLGLGAPFVTLCDKAGIRPADLDLSHLVGMATTGAPLAADGYDWIYRNVKSDLWFAPMSGGTDVAAGFVGPNPMLPVYAGEMQCRLLGCAVRAVDSHCREVWGQVGELVVTEPMPSMPLYFWGDTDGTRFNDSYYRNFPGVWQHGDWIAFSPTGGSVIYGRSDATLNRKGLRLGSSEIYRAVESLPQIADSLVVDLEYLGRDSFMPLFVVVADGHIWDQDLKIAIEQVIRTQVSARFVPNDIVPISEVPRTLSGKKLEVPVKKLLLGSNPQTVVNRDAMANPDSFDVFVRYAETLQLE